ncbi:MAG: hypothetical protein D3925_10235 [Candidatus Electrothrix sp. AR5]|nr:hypothetical protein [Candidatus Electrothrix sp. AR5]
MNLCPGQYKLGTLEKGKKAAISAVKLAGSMRDALSLVEYVVYQNIKSNSVYSLAEPFNFY